MFMYSRRARNIVLSTNKDIMDTKERMKVKFGVLSRQDGSVMFCDGETVVMAGFCGPVEVKTKNMLIDKASVETHFRPKVGLPGLQETFYGSIIRGILETSIAISLYPRTSLIAAIQEMQNDGELLASAINAVCLAALDAGIEMKFMFAAASCYLSTDGILHMTTGSLDKDQKASFVLVFDSLEAKMIASHTKGTFSQEQYKEAIRLCRKQCAETIKFFESSLIDSHIKK